jgi:hypothetical protein
LADRVLSTAAARDAFLRFGKIINGDLHGQLRALTDQGRILPDPNKGYGRLAGEFRAKWTEANAALQKMKTALDQLKGDIQKINQNIMSSGGN